MKENKTKLLILIILVISTIVVVILNGFILKKDNNELFQKSIEEIGNQFYQNYLYVDQYEIVERCVNDEQSIRISIADLIRSAEGLDKEKIKKMDFFKKCDISNSTIVYTPRTPISATNYDMVVTLDCQK